MVSNAPHNFSTENHTLFLLYIKIFDWFLCLMAYQPSKCLKQKLKLLGLVKSFAIFSPVLVCGMYITWPQQFKPWKVSTVVISIAVVGVLTHSAFFYSVCDLKTAQMNMQRSLIWEFMHYEFESGHNATTDAAKNLCYVKSKGAVHYGTIIR